MSDSEHDGLWIREFGALVWFVPDPIGPYAFIFGIWGIDKAIWVYLGDGGIITAGILVLELAGLFLVVAASLKLDEMFRHASETVTSHCSPEPVHQAFMMRRDRILRKFDQYILRVLDHQIDWTTQSAPPRLRRYFTLAGWTLHWIYLAEFNSSSYSIYQFEYYHFILSMHVIIPFVYYPLFADVVAIILNVHLGLPARIRDAELYSLNDITYFGGLRSVGRLIELSGFIYVLGLLLYFLLTIFRALNQGGTTGSMSSTISVDVFYVILGGVAGILLLSYPIFALHRHMHLHKTQHLQDVSRDVSSLSGCDGWIPRLSCLSDSSMQTYLVYSLKRQEIDKQREFPVVFSRVYSLVAALVITPVVNELVIRYLPQFLAEYSVFIVGVFSFG